MYSITHADGATYMGIVHETFILPLKHGFGEGDGYERGWQGQAGLFLWANETGELDRRI